MSQASLPCLSPLAKSITKASLYEHYKGLRYKILGIARHSETLEELVVYQALYGEGDIWVRPLSLFCLPEKHFLVQAKSFATL